MPWRPNTELSDGSACGVYRSKLCSPDPLRSVDITSILPRDCKVVPNRCRASLGQTDQMRAPSNQIYDLQNILTATSALRYDPLLNERRCVLCPYLLRIEGTTPGTSLSPLSQNLRSIGVFCYDNKYSSAQWQTLSE